MISIPLAKLQWIRSAWLIITALFADPRRRFAIFIGLMVVAGVAAWWRGVPTPTQARGLLEAAGTWAPIVGVISTAALILVLFPRGGLAILAGMIASPVVAIVCTFIGTLVGAAIAFAGGRVMGRPFLQRWVQRVPNGRVARFEQWAEDHGVAAMIYARIIPLLPCGFLNYSMGATDVRFWVFLIGTGIGIVPSTVFYVLLGAFFAAPTSPALLISAGVGLFVGFLGLICIRNARRQLMEMTTSPNPRKISLAGNGRLLGSASR